MKSFQGIASCVTALGLRGHKFDSRGVLNTKAEVKLHVFVVDELNIYSSTNNLINRFSKINNIQLN